MGHKSHRSKLVISGIATLVLVVGIALYFFLKSSTPGLKRDQTANQPGQQAPGPNPSGNPVFDKTKYSIDQAGSIWVVVNKKRPLPANYVPVDLTSTVLGGQLQSEAAKALNDLVVVAKKEGVNFTLLSSYRSYGQQVSVYNGYVQSDGQANADTYSARPRHSEHQTGLAADLGDPNGNCDLQTCFGDTAGGKWLAAHAHEYGFIIRYQKGKDSVTGYQYEPWHIRYVGPELSNELNRANQTMEEFFGIVPDKQPY